MAEPKNGAQEAIILSEEQFRRAIQEAPFPTIMQAGDGQVLQISRSWTELTGYKLADMPNFNEWLTNVVYDGADAVKNRMHKLLKGSERSVNVDFSVCTHDKGVRDWSFGASSPGTLLDGRRFIIGVAVDITERKKAQEALKESSFMYQTLLNSIDQGYFIIDVIFDENDKPVDMYYVESNAAATMMLGMDFKGKRLREINPNYEESWYEIFGEVAKTGKSRRLQSYAAPDKKWYDFYIFKIGGPKSRRIGNIFLDITQRKKAEQALLEK